MEKEVIAMEERKTPLLPKELNSQYEEAIRKRLDSLMRTYNVNQLQLCQQLKERGLSLEQGNLSSMLKGTKHFPLSLIVHLCDIFHISLAELVDENFGGAKQSGGNSPSGQVYSNDLLQLVPYLGPNFVLDPADPHFNGYLQTYYVYLFPSRMETETIRTGTLTLSPKGSVCEAVLKIHTNKFYDSKPYIKVYRGCCIISTTVRAVYILLSNESKGELTFLNFTYFDLDKAPLNCRIAGTIVNATGSENPPTIQRLFLSRMEIQPEHLELMRPHLYLNSEYIRIRPEHLDALREEDPKYREILDLITPLCPPIPTCYLSDRVLMSFANSSMSKADAQRFLSRLRILSEHDCFNKISARADYLCHKLLRSLGYFHDYDYEN